MRKILAGLFLSLSLTLAACGDTVGGQAQQAQQTQESTQSSTPTTQSSTATVPSESATYTQQETLTRLREITASFDNVPDAEMIELFESGCNVLRTGGTIDELVNGALSAGIPDYDAGALVGATVGSTCPEFTYLVEEYIERNTPTD